MRIVRALGLLLLLLPVHTGWAEETDRLALSREAAVAWLALINGAWRVSGYFIR